MSRPPLRLLVTPSTSSAAARAGAGEAVAPTRKAAASRARRARWPRGEENKHASWHALLVEEPSWLGGRRGELRAGGWGLRAAGRRGASPRRLGVRRRRRGLGRRRVRRAPAAALPRLQAGARR